MDASHVIFRLSNKPLRFNGCLLGESSICDEDDTGLYTRVRFFKTEGGSFVWAWDLSECEEPEDEELQRADAVAIRAGEGTSPVELAQVAWDKRPRENARLTEASTRAFHAAARRDGAVAAALYEEVQ
jgi:hypothetical protein